MMHTRNCLPWVIVLGLCGISWNATTPARRSILPRIARRRNWIRASSRSARSGRERGRDLGLELDSRLRDARP